MQYLKRRQWLTCNTAMFRWARWRSWGVFIWFPHSTSKKLVCSLVSQTAGFPNRLAPGTWLSCLPLLLGSLITHIHVCVFAFVLKKMLTRNRSVRAGEKKMEENDGKQPGPSTTTLNKEEANGKKNKKQSTVVPHLLWGLWSENLLAICEIRNVEIRKVQPHYPPWHSL